MTHKPNIISLSKFTAVVLLTFLSSLHAVYCSNQKVFEYYTVENGLSQNRVDCITKDQNNFLWIGTSNGLNRFDGYDFKVYKHSDTDTNTLPDNFIYTLCVDSFNNIWVGSAKGLSVYIYKLDKFIRIPSINSRIYNFIYNKGNLWICGQGVLEVIHPKNENGDFEFRTSQFLNNDIWNKYNINCINLINNQDLWIGTDKGVFAANIHTKKHRKVLSGIVDGNDIFENSVNDIFLDSKNRLWVGMGVGLVKYNLATKKAKFYNTDFNDPKSLPNNVVTSIIEDINGNILIGTLGSLSKYNQDEENFFNILYELNNPYVINNNFVNCIYTDNDGIVWIGTERGGLNKYNENQKEFEVIGRATNMQPGLNSNTVNAIFEDDNYLYIGTAGGGVNLFDKRTSKYHYLMNDASNQYTLLNNFISVISKDVYGNILIGTWGGGLHTIKPHNIPLRKVDRLNEVINIFDYSEFISSIASDHRGRVWIGTLGGVEIYNPLNGMFTEFRVDKYNINQVGCMKFAPNGDLWIGTTTGLYWLKSNSEGIVNKNSKVLFFQNILGDVKSLSGGYITDLLYDSSDSLWISTYGNGINKFVEINSDNKIIVERYGIEQGISNNIVYAIEEDEAGNIWASTGYGLSKLERDKSQFTNYFQFDGIANNEFYWAAGFKNKDGKIFFGGMDGVTMFYPKNIKANKTPPVLKLTDLRIYNKQVEINNKYHGVVVLNQNIIDEDELNFSYKSKEFTIWFSALHYNEPLQNKYMYKLKGYDNDWKTTTSNARFASYSQLPGGEYVFQLKGANSDGVWTKEPLELKINITPPIWKTLWFQLIVALIALSLSIGFYFIRIVSLKRNQKLLEHIVKKRTMEIEAKNQQLLEQTEELNEINTLLEEKTQKIEEQTNELSYKNEDLENLNATKDKLFSIIAHDLKNPFNTLMGFSELVYERYDNFDKEKVRQILEMINSSAKSIYELLNNLLHWARNQTGSIAFSPENINLNELIMASEILIESVIEKKNIRLEIAIPEYITVFADRNMVSTILRNIIGNSVKYTENEKIIIRAEEINKIVKIEVIDNGIGMDAETVDRLFLIQPKKSVKGTRGEYGTGLGLVICKEFIEKNGGELSVQSQPGIGSTFSFTLPKA